MSGSLISFVRRVYRAVHPDLRGMIDDLDNDQILLLRASLYRHPAKAHHLQMVQDECARRRL